MATLPIFAMDMGSRVSSELVSRAAPKFGATPSDPALLVNVTARATGLVNVTPPRHCLPRK